MNTPIPLALNTSTLRCGEVSLSDKIEATAEAGFSGIEPWAAELDAWVEDGRTLADLRREIAAAGLRTVNLIGFPRWASGDSDERARGLREAGRLFAMAAELECPAVAAPPAGIQRQRLPLSDVAARFAELCAVARPFGVEPLLEYWGIAQTLGTVGEALQVAADAGPEGIRILADVFHTFKGSGGFSAFSYLNGDNLGLLHLNDVPSGPAAPAREAMTDKDRVYPGDGCAPLAGILGNLRRSGFAGPVSVELFNENYWSRPLREVARTAYSKATGVLSESGA